MPRIAVLYGTTEGHTAKVAQHVAARLRELGCEAEVQHLADLPDDFALDGDDGVVIGASIHEGHHQRYVVKWAKAHREALAARPCALFTVCLGIKSPDPAERAEAEGYSERFAERTGLRPSRAAVFAGALKYTQYSWLKRFVMKRIAEKEGGDTDTSRDFEYTDWAQVDAFAAAFAQLVSERG